jgi:hypothetical protein
VPGLFASTGSLRGKEEQLLIIKFHKVKGDHAVAFYFICAITAILLLRNRIPRGANFVCTSRDYCSKWCLNC